VASTGEETERRTAVDSRAFDVGLEKGFRMSRLWLLLLLWPGVAIGGVDADRVARAIAVVEDAQGRIGAAGEQGELQFLPVVWRMYSPRPVSWATGSAVEMRAEQRRVAQAHVAWICARLARLGLEESAWSVALVHNAGYGRVRDRRVLPRQRDFAERVANIYADFLLEGEEGGLRRPRR
jgi:hypothetical protein